MAKLYILLLSASLAFAEDKPKPDLQAKYTSIVLSIANVQTARIETLKKMDDDNREYAANIAQLQSSVRAIVQAKINECAAENKKIDEKALDKDAALSCVEKEGK